MPRAGPPWHHIRPEGVRTGGPQLTAGHGRPVCQPWWYGDKAERQHPEAMCFAGSTTSKSAEYASIRMIHFLIPPNRGVVILIISGYPRRNFRTSGKTAAQAPWKIAKVLFSQCIYTKKHV